MVLIATTLLLAGPISKAEAVRVAEAGVARLGFHKARAYGAWMQHGNWNVSLKDMRGHVLFASVDDEEGRLIGIINKSRWPKDVGQVPQSGKAPERFSTLARMQSLVGGKVRLRLHKWGQSWARRVESHYDAFVGSRLLMADQGVIRPYLLQDPDSAEVICFFGLAKIPAAVIRPDRIKPSDADQIAVTSISALPATRRGKPEISSLPARPALYLPAKGPAVPVWRVRVDSVFRSSRRLVRRQEDVLVNTQSGKVEAIVPRRDW